MAGTSPGLCCSEPSYLVPAAEVDLDQGQVLGVACLAVVVLEPALQDAALPTVVLLWVIEDMA